MGASESVSTRLYTDTRIKAGATVHTRRRGLLRCGVGACEVAADVVLCTAGVWYGAWCAFASGGRGSLSVGMLGWCGVAAGAVVTLLLDRDGAYGGDGSLLRIRETERVLRVMSQMALLAVALGVFFDRQVPRAMLVYSFVIVCMLLLFQKSIVWPWAMGVSRSRAWKNERAVVYGAGEMGRRAVSVLFKSARLRVEPVAVIEDAVVPEGCRLAEMGYGRGHSVPVLSGPLTVELLRSCRCDVLVAATRDLSAEEIAAAEECGVRVAYISGLEHCELLSVVVEADGLTLAFAGTEGGSRAYAVTKRLVDVVVSLFLLVACAPLLVAIGIVVRLDSAGPALFVQERVGRKGELFRIFKFRSMHVNAPAYQRSPSTWRDSRITRVGRWLRRASLDELPQLLNVLRGEMSLVGPRPEMPYIVRSYSAHQRQRLSVLPGITGLWQLSADRAYPIHECLDYDFYYIRNRGVFMDLAILVHTFFVAVRGGV